METEIKIQQAHNGISSLELGLTWSQTRSDPSYIAKENTNPIYTMEYYKLTIKDNSHRHLVK